MDNVSVGWSDGLSVWLSPISSSSSSGNGWDSQVLAPVCPLISFFLGRNLGVLAEEIYHKAPIHFWVFPFVFLSRYGYIIRYLPSYWPTLCVLSGRWLEVKDEWYGWLRPFEWISFLGRYLSTTNLRNECLSFWLNTEPDKLATAYKPEHVCCNICMRAGRKQ